MLPIFFQPIYTYIYIYIYIYILCLFILYKYIYNIYIYIVSFLKLARSAETCHSEYSVLQAKQFVTDELFQFSLYILTTG